MRRQMALAYLSLNWLFLIGVVVQVFVSGMVVVAWRTGWDVHIGLGHFLGLPLTAMLIVMHVGRLPKHIKTLTWILFGVYFIQADVVIFMRGSMPLVSALHPVFALFDFAIAWILIGRTRSALSLGNEQELAAKAN